MRWMWNGSLRFENVRPFLGDALRTASASKTSCEGSRSPIGDVLQTVAAQHSDDCDRFGAFMGHRELESDRVPQTVPDNMTSTRLPSTPGTSPTAFEQPRSHVTNGRHPRWGRIRPSVPQKTRTAAAERVAVQSAAAKHSPRRASGGLRS
jgi:hypothetical protein